MKQAFIKQIPKVVLVVLEKVFAMTRKKVNPPFPYDKSTNRINLPSNIVRELSLLIANGNKVEAVKRVTQLTGAGLRVSKDYVDNLERKHD